jgi:VanZ family protein
LGAEGKLSGLLGSQRFRGIAMALFIAGALLVIYGSLNPRLSVPGSAARSYLVHFVAYGGLAVLGSLAMPGNRSISVVGVGLVVMGGAVEFAQLHVPGRTGSIEDAAVNLCGVTLGCLAGLAIRRCVARHPGGQHHGSF